MEMNMPRKSLRDEHIHWNMKRVRLWADRYAIGSQTDSSIAAIGGIPFGTNHANIAVLASDSGIGGIQFTATGSEAILPWWEYDIDGNLPIYIRHLWTTHHTGSTAAALFVTTYSSITTTARINTSTTALTVPLVASTKGQLAFQPTWTNWGKIAPIATGGNAYTTFPENTISLVFDTVISSVSNFVIGSEFVYLIATEIMYTPRKTFGTGSQVEATYLVSDLSSMRAGAALDLP